MKSRWHAEPVDPIAHCRYFDIDDFEVRCWDDTTFKFKKLSQRRQSNAERLFIHFAQRWYWETGHLSGIRDKAINENYQYILGMGEQVIPFVLSELEQKGGHWFWALKHLCRVDPVPKEHRGDVPKMRESWLTWGRAYGYLR